MMASLQTIIICIANDPKDHAMVIPKHNCEDIIQISCLICLSSDMLLPIRNKTLLCGYYFAGCSIYFIATLADVCQTVCQTSCRTSRPAKPILHEGFQLSGPTNYSTERSLM